MSLTQQPEHAPPTPERVQHTVIDCEDSPDTVLLHALPSHAVAIASLPSAGDERARKHVAHKTFVLTGIFDAPSDKTGLAKGKDAVTKLIQSHGGRVVDDVSGMTDILLIGHGAGERKVRAASGRRIPVIDLDGLAKVMRGEDAPPAEISTWSAGYKVGGKRNGLALASTDDNKNALVASLRGYTANKRLRAAPSAPRNRAEDEADDAGAKTASSSRRRAAPTALAPARSMRSA